MERCWREEEKEKAETRKKERKRRRKKLSLSSLSSQKKNSNAISTTSNCIIDMERSYHPESSGSRPITEDKLGWARLVLR